MYQNEFAHCPANRLDSFLTSSTLVIEQRHVRREMSSPIPPQSSFHRHSCKSLPQPRQFRDAILREKNERMAVLPFYIGIPATEIHDTIEGYLEWRHRNSGRRVYRSRSNILWETKIVAQVIQRYVKAFRTKRLPLQPIFALQMARKLRGTSCSGVIRKDCKK
jgi:hypothetical protein